MNLPAPTERVERVLVFASDEADGLGHGFITCQHLFYALSRENKGIAQAALREVGVMAEAVHEILAEAAAPHERTPMSQLDMAEETRVAFGQAAAVAQEWGHRWLDTEHLLYGVVVTANSADELLALLNVTPSAILDQLNRLRQNAPPAAIRDEATHAYRLTLESAWLLSLATDTARRFGSPVINSLHLLIALATFGSPARDVLVETFGVTPVALTRRVGGQGGMLPSDKRLPLHDDVQRILGYAIGKAWNRGHLAVKPIHIAMGLARAGRHPALDLLAEFGASQAALVDALEEVMPPPVV